jgi:hypothetical protein
MVETAVTVDACIRADANMEDSAIEEQTHKMGWNSPNYLNEVITRITHPPVPAAQKAFKSKGGILAKDSWESFFCILVLLSDTTFHINFSQLDKILSSLVKLVKIILGNTHSPHHLPSYPNDPTNHLARRTTGHRGSTFFALLEISSYKQE